MQCCTFEIGHHRFGLDVLHVQEVLRSQPITPVPLAHSAVAGLLNLRGQIITVLDLRTLFGLDGQTDFDTSLNVIMPSAEGTVSLTADAIGDVLHLADEQLEPLPANTPDALRPLLSGVHVHSGQLYLVLDAKKALAHVLSAVASA
jgi:purine-binding chemotaxis protein CheW